MLDRHLTEPDELAKAFDCGVSFVRCFRFVGPFFLSATGRPL